MSAAGHPPPPQAEPTAPTAPPASQAEPAAPPGAPAVERFDVEAAVARLANHVRRTPVLEVEPGGFAPVPVTLKLELLQHTGSFKPRGAFNRLLACPVPAAGVVAASGGNAGLAVAHAARALGHRAVVVVPSTAPAAKVDRLRRLGAEVHLVGTTYAEALAAASELAAATGALPVHAYDQPEVVAGQGTVAAELAEQAPGVDTVLVAVGGGGLIGGIAAWYDGRARVVAVETEGCPTLARALGAGRPVDVDVGGVAADALGARRVGELCWAGRHWLAGSVLVADADVPDAQRALWERARLVAEPGGATALAALTSGRYRPQRGERVAVVVCGANVDPATVAR